MKKWVPFVVYPATLGTCRLEGVFLYHPVAVTKDNSASVLTHTMEVMEQVMTTGRILKKFVSEGSYLT